MSNMTAEMPSGALSLSPEKIVEVQLLQALGRLADAYTAKLNAETAILTGAAAAPIKAKASRAVKDTGFPPAPAGSAAPAINPATLTKEQAEIVKKEALETASAYVRRFQKASPDGMARAKAIQQSKFGGKSIAQMDAAEHLAFTATLKAEIEAVPA